MASCAVLVPGQRPAVLGQPDEDFLLPLPAGLTDDPHLMRGRHAAHLADEILQLRLPVLEPEVLVSTALRRFVGQRNSEGTRREIREVLDGLQGSPARYHSVAISARAYDLVDDPDRVSVTVGDEQVAALEAAIATNRWRYQP
ncbi:hypothetical protein JMJ56_26960 [Belnapia sp. T18]|uniref:Uncharacterized protein n=1 Tax=Belnapia arida TaxID=2804533 RepID=A0ABS1UD73_9PROT|nr:hypothetical protein [Belnapia arida]MBL6081637.1 hypothetical protein [Belnapia arida]